MRLNQAIFVTAATFTFAGVGNAFAQGTMDAPAGSPTEATPPPATDVTPSATPATPADATPAPADVPAPVEVTPAPVAEPVPVTPVYTAPAPNNQYSDIVIPPTVHGHWMPASIYGVAIMAGGGVTDFTQGATRSETSTGGSWTARLAFGTRSILGFEASYIGGANNINALGFGNTTLVRNGAEGVIRLNAPLYAHDTLLEPYAFGGVGWNTYRLSNVNNVTASVSTSADNTVSVPLGLGFSTGYHGFIADLRYTIRPTYDQNMFRNQSGSALTNWDFGGMIGYEF
jgi:hypothetical protein